MSQLIYEYEILTVRQLRVDFGCLLSWTHRMVYELIFDGIMTVDESMQQNVRSGWIGI